MPLQPREEAVVDRIYDTLAPTFAGPNLKCLIKFSVILTRNERAAINAFLQQQKAALQVYLLNKVTLRQLRLDRLRQKALTKYNALASKLSQARSPLNAFKVVGDIVGDPNCQVALESIMGFFTKKQVELPEFDNAFSTITGYVDGASYELNRFLQAADVHLALERTISRSLTKIDEYLTVMNAVDIALAAVEDITQWRQ